MSASYPDHLRQEVERYLEGMSFSAEPLTEGLEEAMRYSLLAGGKRIRPVLALATARAVGLVLPQLKGKLDGTAIRVPTANVSLVSLDFVPRTIPGSVAEVNNLFRDAAASGPLKGIVVYSTDPLVSSDFNHVTASCSFDATQTSLVDGGKLVRVCGWYDNEWGFSNRMADTAAVFGAL